MAHTASEVEANTLKRRNMFIRACLANTLHTLLSHPPTPDFSLPRAAGAYHLRHKRQYAEILNEDPPWQPWQPQQPQPFASTATARQQARHAAAAKRRTCRTVRERCRLPRGTDRLTPPLPTHLQRTGCWPGQPSRLSPNHGSFGFRNVCRHDPHCRA